MAQIKLDLNLPGAAGDKKRWGQLDGSAKALVLAQTIEQSSKPCLIICNNNSEAEQLHHELAFFLQPGIPLRQFPDWETLPYDNFSPHQDIISERLASLQFLGDMQQGALIVGAPTLMQRLAPKHYIYTQQMQFNLGQRLAADKLHRQLEQAGYVRVDTVYEHGQFAVRGSLLDLFPMGSQQPYRIEFFDDEIESLRSFDPENQRTIEKLDQIKLLAGREFPLDKDGITRFKDNWIETFGSQRNPKDSPLYQDVSAGINSPGLEYYLPLFFDQTALLFDYIPQDSLILCPAEFENAAQQYWFEAQNRYDQLGINPQRPLLKPEQVFAKVDEVFSHLKTYAQVQYYPGAIDHKAGVSNFDFPASQTLTIDSKLEQPLATLKLHLDQADPATRFLFCAESAGRREALIELLQKIDYQATTFDAWQDFLNSDTRVAITTAPLAQGLVIQQLNIHLIAESQLFGQRVMQKRRRNKQQQDQSDAIVKNLTELNIGAPVVHIDHGVGRYLGLQSISVEGQSEEFLQLEYADEAKLYVPVASLHLISRYSGASEDNAPLNKLGNEQWGKAKRKAAEKIRDVAAELLDVYAKRAARKGMQHQCEKTAYDSFSASFPFEETIDQEQAIMAVRTDMFNDKPMDRLVCGDVGFGKTEVAMRAAFIAIQSGKQVAVLVPTTLLAQQHYENFRDRFADWPVNVEVLSRFKTNKEQNAALEKVASGNVDIIIGTHKLLQKDVAYKDLGLLIIDEEHRFGVRQKDSLKALRAEVDILTLTATPIPRTLNMSMSGIRDLSIIATPPAKRLSVKTFVKQHDEQLIKEAVLREIIRGGQVYLLHNDVSSIDKTARELEALVPDARVGVAHGQMRERELEQVMSDFYHKRFNILVSTTIIETGIDVPSANTIIIERADKFGLAQLHQLRGRVGRSHHQAYAYLLTPDPRQLSKDAERRLEAIEQASDLGSGFTLATHDLEIRGAGELLGDDQSGQIHSIGFSLYMDMLNRAVESIKQGKTPDPEAQIKSGAEVNLRLPALIPEDYLADVHMRLTLYKRIASTQDQHELKELQIEMIDRFGLLPDAAKNLMAVTHVKQIANKIGITKIELGEKGGRVLFSQDTLVEPITIVQLMQNNPQEYRLDGPNGLKISKDLSQQQDRIKFVEQLIQQLSPNTSH